MFSHGLFSLGLILPFILLFLGFVTIGFSFSGVAIAVRLQADSESTAGKLQSKIDLSIAILAVSALMPILAIVLSHYGAYYNAGIVLAMIGLLMLWPVSAMLAIRGRGAGRMVLLVGHGLIAIWIVVIVVSILINIYG